LRFPCDPLFVTPRAIQVDPSCSGKPYQDRSAPAANDERSLKLSGTSAEGITGGDHCQLREGFKLTPQTA